MSIESKQFIATAADITGLATSIFEADQTSGTGRTTYLRALIGTLQHELGSAPRVRSSKGEKLSDEALVEHLKAFESVAARFGEAVTNAARGVAKSPTELQSLTGFARSAASTLRSYIKARNDVRSLAAARVVKSSIAVPTTRRKLTAPIIRRRALRAQAELESAATNLMAMNREMARETLQPVLAKLAKILGLSSHPTKDHGVAEAEGRPWQTKTGIFVPIALQ